MLVDRDAPEDVFARVPELGEQTDPVLVPLDHLLDDDQLYQQVRGALARRSRLTPVHGRHSTPAEVLLRLLVVPHRYTWSYAQTVARVADSLVLRWVCRISFQRVPPKTPLLRWAQPMRPVTLQALVERVALLARQAKVTHARKLRSESTGVQTPLHPPTDSGRLGDGVRVLSRLLQRAQPRLAGVQAGVRMPFRRRVRSARRVLHQVHRVRRRAGEEAAEAQRGLYARLLEITRQTMRQAQPVGAAVRQREQDVASAAQTAPQRVAQRLLVQFARFLPLVQQGMRQGMRPARSRVRDGRLVASTERVLSRFEPHPRVVKRGKIGAGVECGRPVLRDEVEGGIVTRFHVLADSDSECHQALPALQPHPTIFAQPPWLVTADRRLHAKGLQASAHALGVG